MMDKVKCLRKFFKKKGIEDIYDKCFLVFDCFNFYYFGKFLMFCFECNFKLCFVYIKYMINLILCMY